MMLCCDMSSNTHNFVLDNGQTVNGMRVSTKYFINVASSLERTPWSTRPTFKSLMRSKLANKLWISEIEPELVRFLSRAKIIARDEKVDRDKKFDRDEKVNRDEKV